VPTLVLFAFDFEILYLHAQIIYHNLGFTREETLLFLEATDYNSYYYNAYNVTGRYILVSFKICYPSKLKNWTWMV